MLAAPLMGSLALVWIAVEVTTIISALLVAIEDTDGAAEAAWKYVLLASAGLFPVHTWLPDAHSEAPTPVSALLSGSLLAVSFYAILRFYQVPPRAWAAGSRATRCWRSGWPRCCWPRGTCSASGI
jgi:formate hydrogenlyase subunit 3/multisubunit Na+/H+ antiporter MnhD subunit